MSTSPRDRGFSIIQELKDFINRGNVLDLAVAVVLGAAFGAVVTSFVDNILMQVIAAIGGQPDFSALALDIGDGKILYGAFLNAVISFVFIALGGVPRREGGQPAAQGEGGGAGRAVRGRAPDRDPGPAQPALSRRFIQGQCAARRLG